jgi:hypothetical protein
LHAERARQQSLEEELHAVRRQLESVRSNLSGTPAPNDTWSRGAATTATTPYATPTPYGGALHTPSYQALSSGMNHGAAPAGARKNGADAYYTARLQKVLGPKADIHNLLEHPGVTIEEAFGAVLASPTADKVPWIITDDRACPLGQRPHCHCIASSPPLGMTVVAVAVAVAGRAQAGLTTCTKATTTTYCKPQASPARRST